MPSRARQAPVQHRAYATVNVAFTPLYEDADDDDDENTTLV
jgi:hypothetical protein